jgi:hypothetical protein
MHVNEHCHHGCVALIDFPVTNVGNSRQFCRCCYIVQLFGVISSSFDVDSDVLSSDRFNIRERKDRRLGDRGAGTMIFQGLYV